MIKLKEYEEDSYKDKIMKHAYCAEYRDILIRPLHSYDIELLRKWRNDEKISFYLREVPYITPEKQYEWYIRYLDNPNSLFFVTIDRQRNTVIGSVALYDFRDNKCTIGKIVIGDKLAQGKGAGHSSLVLALTIAMKKLEVDTVTLSVHEDNIPARSIYEKVGFREVGKHVFVKGGHETEMEITKKEFLFKNKEVKNVRIYKEKTTVNSTGE